MRTDQLVALVKRHARLAFKEGRAMERGDAKAAKWGVLRARVLNQILREVDPYVEVQLRA